MGTLPGKFNAKSFVQVKFSKPCNNKLHIFYHENHWMPVVNLNALYKNNRVGSFYKCLKCFKSYYDNKLYKVHVSTCDGSKLTQNEKVPDPAVLKFTDQDKTVDMGLVMYADIEAYLSPVEGNDAQKTVKTQRHYPIAIGNMVISKMPNNELHEQYVEFKGEDCMSEYIDYLEYICQRIYDWDPTTRIKAKREPQDWRDFNSAIRCYMCGMVFKYEKGGKNFDHDHLTGKYRGAACNSCNRKWFRRG